METNLKIRDELQKLNSRMDRVEKKLDLLDDDRQIFESIQGRLTALEEEWRLTRQHDNAVKKDLKEEIGIANDKVVAKVEIKVEEVKEAFEKKKASWWKKFLGEHGGIRK